MYKRQALAGGRVRSKPVDAVEPATAIARPLRPQRVLLVEDNPVNLAVAQRLLQVLGVDCHTAGNGKVALEKMIEGEFDLVLMDCQMPVLDGYAATRSWREREGPVLHRLPIVAMTANAMAGDRQKCLEAGMDDYLPKPVTRDELAACLQRWRPITDERKAGGAGTAEAAPAAGPAAPPDPVPPPAAQPAATPLPASTQPMMKDSVLGELRELLGASGVAQIVSMYLADAPRLLAQLERAALDNDLATLRSVAHTLKSSSANMGAMALSDAARTLEHGVRDSSITQPEMHVARIVGEYARVQPALRALAGG